MSSFVKVIAVAAYLSLLSSAADCDGMSDETSLLQLSSSVKHRSDHLERESQLPAGFNVSAVNATANWTDYLSAGIGLPPPIGNPDLKGLGLSLAEQPAPSVKSAEWVMNNTGFNVSEKTRWTDYKNPLPPPIGNPVLKSLANLAEKDVDVEEEIVAAPGDTKGRDAVWVFNNTGYNVSEKARWTDYKNPLPPPIGNPVLKSLASLDERGSDEEEQTVAVKAPQPGPDTVRDAVWVFNNTGFNVSEKTRWTDYLSPVPPPNGNQALKSLGLNLIEKNDIEKNDTAANWTERWTNHLPPYGREQYPPLEPAVVQPTLLQQTPFNDSDVNWTERWENYLPPHSLENWPPLQPTVVNPSADGGIMTPSDNLAMLQNDSAANWTERWTNFLPPGNWQYPPLEPAVVRPTLLQQQNDSATNWTERWTNYLPPGNWQYPPLEPAVVRPTLLQQENEEKNDTAANWTERWTNHLPPYTREQYPPLEPAVVAPTLIQKERHESPDPGNPIPDR